MISIIFKDIIRNRIVIAYTILLGLFSWSAFALEDNSSKGILTLLNIILLIVPLVSILFSTIYVYNSTEFIEMLLSQPLKRTRIWRSFYFSLIISLASAFFLGCGIPLLIFSPNIVGLMMFFTGLIITMVFVSIAFFCVMLTRDKAKGIGIAILLWMYFALFFDGLVLFLLFQLSDYPIEHAMVFITALSPIDLVRIVILLHLDISAMMGYTGAIFKEYFGNTLGMVIAFLVLNLWVVVPFLISLVKFKNKDL